MFARHAISRFAAVMCHEDVFFVDEFDGDEFDGDVEAVTIDRAEQQIDNEFS